MNQFLTVKFYSICIFMIDIIPKRLKLFFVKVIIQSILLNLSFMAIAYHIIQRMFIKNTLNQCMQRCTKGT